MILGIYSMFDSKTGFQPVTVSRNNDSAVREFAHAVKSTRSLMNTFAADFSLFKVGEFDTESGRLIGFDAPESLVNGASFVGGIEDGD